MAKMRRMDSKEALGRQRAELQRGARHRQFVGQGPTAEQGHEAELEKVRRMREAQRAREEQRRELDRLRRPITDLVAELVADTFRLTRTLVAFPFRLAFALRGRRASEA